MKPLMPSKTCPAKHTAKPLDQRTAKPASADRMEHEKNLFCAHERPAENHPIRSPTIASSTQHDFPRPALLQGSHGDRTRIPDASQAMFIAENAYRTAPAHCLLLPFRSDMRTVRRTARASRMQTARTPDTTPAAMAAGVVPETPMLSGLRSRPVRRRRPHRADRPALRDC